MGSWQRVQIVPSLYLYLIFVDAAIRHFPLLSGCHTAFEEKEGVCVCDTKTTDDISHLLVSSFRKFF